MPNEIFSLPSMNWQTCIALSVWAICWCIRGIMRQEKKGG